MGEYNVKLWMGEKNALLSILSHLQQENNRLKNAVSGVMPHDNHQQVLLKMEEFQSEFLQKDIVIELLRNEVAELDKQVSVLAGAGKATSPELTGMHIRLQRDINNLERHLNYTRSKYANFVAGVVYNYSSPQLLMSVA